MHAEPRPPKAGAASAAASSDEDALDCSGAFLHSVNCTGDGWGSKERESGGEARRERTVGDEDKTGQKKKKERAESRVTVVTFHYSAWQPRSHARGASRATRS